MAGVEHSGGNAPLNPLDPVAVLEEPRAVKEVNGVIHPQSDETMEDSAVTKAEKFERHGLEDCIEESANKRRKLDANAEDEDQVPTKSERQKGVAPIKAELVLSGKAYAWVTYAA